MSNFEVFVLLLLFFIVLGLLGIAGALKDLRKDVAEVWKRMQRID